MSNATTALAELAGLATAPGRASVLAGQIGAALSTTPADAEHRELFAACFTVLAQRQKGVISGDAWARLWGAMGGLLEHYGIETLEDLQALDAGGSACNA